MKTGKGFARRTAERETENFDEINRIQKVAVVPALYLIANDLSEVEETGKHFAATI